MKINYVLLYGTPYLKYELFNTFEQMSDFIVRKGIVNYSIFEKMKDEKEVEMIYRDNDIRVLEDRVDKAIEYLESYNTDFKNCKFGEAPISLRELGDLLDILRGENNENNNV